MKGLRIWERDDRLPAVAGDAALCPPTPAQVGQLVVPALLRPGAAAPVSIGWTYARWKPGVSISCGYELRFADGARRALHVKRWRGDKGEAVAAQDLATLHEDWSDDRLLACAWAAGRRELSVVSPADRALPGLGKLLDGRRLVRRLVETGLCGEYRPRAHRTEIRLLRHRPGRRAVLRLELGLRAPDGTHDTLTLAGRVLPPHEVAAVVAARRACAAPALFPRLLDVEERTGILLEQWLPGSVPAPDEFGHAAAAGAALAALHALPVGGAPAAASADASFDAALFEPFAGLAASAAALRRQLAPRGVSQASPAWTHGDLHPDQFMLDADGRASLLDLDLLGVRAPCTDLASWIADALAADPDSDQAEAGASLLDGYCRAGGTPPSPDELTAAVVSGLLARAADALRRLQSGAVDRAAQLLARARRVADAGT